MASESPCFSRNAVQYNKPWKQMPVRQMWLFASNAIFQIMKDFRLQEIKMMVEVAVLYVHLASGSGYAI